MPPMISAFALLLAVLPQTSLEPADPVLRDPAQLVVVDLDGKSGLEVADLQRGDFDIIYLQQETREVELIVRADDIERLERLGIPYTVRHTDLEAFYRSRLVQDGSQRAAARGTVLTPPFGAGSLGGYYTFAEVESVLDQLTAQYPAITTDKFSIGTTIEGRDIWAVKVSDNPDTDEAEPEVRFDAMHHAREPEGMQSTLWFMMGLLEGYGTDPVATWIVDNREIWFLPCVNPDGYVHNQTLSPGGGGLWRKNRRDNGDATFGVDLNRNYAFQWGLDDVGSSPSTGSETYRGSGPASEPEVAAMQALIATRSFVTVLTVHTFSNLWLHPWGYEPSLPPNGAEYTEISELATEVNGYPYGSAAVLLYVTNGTTDDHDHDAGSLCWTPEIGSSTDGFWPETSRIIPLAQENELAFRRTALAAGAYMRVESVTVQDAGDGDGFPEAGELVELIVTARNSGKAGATVVSASVTTSSAFASVVSASSSVGAVGSFASGDNSAAPVSLSVNAGTPLGTVIDYIITLAGDGLGESFSGSFQVGTVVELVFDDVELDLGWSAGLVSDTAATGLWEYGDPVGTLQSGSPSNPEDDATPGAGVNCFTTGNGSTTAGGDDVDGGITTLVSPVMHLAGRVEPVVSYERWFANLSGPDDTLEVEITNDGSMWTTVESVATTENQWTEVSFVVSDYVTPTDDVQLRFIASDDPNNSITEAAVDHLRVRAFDDGVPQLILYGSGVLGAPLRISNAANPGDFHITYYSLGTFNFMLGNVQGNPLLIDPATAASFLELTVPPSGRSDVTFNLPNNPALAGQTLYFQSLVIGSGGLFFTGRETLLLQ